MEEKNVLSLDQKSLIYQNAFFAQKVMGFFNREYHSFDHALDVYLVSRGYAIMEGLDQMETFLLGTAALNHDLVVDPTEQDNEEVSARLANAYIRKLGYSIEESARVEEIILATKVPAKPGNDLAKMIICDADLDNLGREDFFERNELLRVELGLPADRDWYYKSLKFLKGHGYYTKSAINKRASGKTKNIHKLEEIIDSFPR